MNDASRRGRGLYRYVLGPFALHSELELPELRKLSEVDGVPRAQRVLVTVQIEELPPGAADLVQVDPWMEASGSEFRLTITDVARFLVRNGREVLVALEPGADPIDVRLYLLGSVFGALCHQNGLLPLHASAIADSGPAIAFLGESGAGKSTLAAFLARRGHRIISDDICLLGREGHEQLNVTPVAGWLKLWRSSLEGLGEDPMEAHRVLSAEDKFRVYLPETGEHQLRLGCVVLLERPVAGEQAAAPRLERVSAATAVAGLMDFTYRSELAVAVGGQEGLFRRCAKVAGQVQAFRLIAPLGWDRMDEVMDLIERELLSSPEGTAAVTSPS